MGRRSHQPTEVMRRQVEAMAGYGVPEHEIAGLLVIDPKTLRKHYRFELDHGHTKANVKVAENLFRKATGEGREAVTAAIFWLKARAHWKETTQIEHGGQPGNPITDIHRIVIAPFSESNDQPPALDEVPKSSVVIWSGVPRSEDSYGSRGRESGR